MSAAETDGRPHDRDHHPEIDDANSLVRLRWSTTPNRSAVNHAPVIEVLSPPASTTAPGRSIELDAVVEDPDGDAVRVRWREDMDAASGESSGAFYNPDTARTRFRVAPEIPSGRELHLLLEAPDAGEPSLACYARVAVTVT